MRRIAKIRAHQAKVQRAEDLIDSGVVIVGSPSTVREKLAAYQDLAGFGNSLTKTQFGTMPHAMVMDNQVAIAEEILRHFRDRLPAPGKRAAAE
jgi:alkanesulfonate monooxygenase SsuD/methylene tetrahydromethanopterin reductase-like flavin-dependent oxidoreductase (luciferase family)